MLRIFIFWVFFLRIYVRCVQAKFAKSTAEIRAGTRDQPVTVTGGEGFEKITATSSCLFAVGFGWSLKDLSSDVD